MWDGIVAASPLSTPLRLLALRNASGQMVAQQGDISKAKEENGMEWTMQIGWEMDIRLGRLSVRMVVGQIRFVEYLAMGQLIMVVGYAARLMKKNGEHTWRPWKTM